MDCRTCQLTLIDLLHGELATDAAEDARAHLRQCASCSSAHERLAAGLRLGRTLECDEPPAAVSARILGMAEAHAQATVARNAAAHTAPNAWRSLLDFVSRFAMARQVGMVTISLLIVAVGLLSLPRRGPAPSPVPAVAGGTVLNPETVEEGVPAGGVRPAERLPLKMDARSGRILSKDQEAPARPESAAIAQAAPEKKASRAPPSTIFAAKPDRAGGRDCGPLVTHYEQVTRVDPTSSAAGQAMIALAECRTALGQTALARPLLERATRIVGVAGRARALLSASDQAERASPASAPAAAAEPGR